MNRSLIALKALMVFMIAGFAIQVANTKGAPNLINSFFAPPMACNDLVHISLDTNCIATVTPEMVLEDLIGSPSDYLIKVYYSGGQEQADLLFDTRDINKKYDYKIWHIQSGNSCWGKILIEDKFPPQLICANDTVRCGDTITPRYLGFPIPNWLSVTIDSIGPFSYLVYGWDRCGYVKLSYKDYVTNYPCDSICIRRIIRMWSATDSIGNNAMCSDTICVLRPTEVDIVYPHHYDDFDRPYIKCDTIFPKLPNGNPSPEFTGWPVPTGCNTLTATYTDLKINVCGATFKVLRRWVILNWCTGRITEYNQIIKVVDDEAPKFRCPKDLTIGMKLYACESDGKLPIPDSVFDCSAWHYDIFTKTIDTKTGNPQDRSKQYLEYNKAENCFYLRGAPEGRIWVIYQLIDECGNISECTIEVGVVDNLAPIPICDQKTTIALGIDGTAKAFAETFNDRSIDNCGIDYFLVRRMNDPCKSGTDIFGPYVGFCCADVGQIVMVALEVTDYWGNKNTCMVEATVQDKEPPIVIPPTDITVDCRFPINWNDLSNFGVVRLSQAERKQIIIADPFYQKVKYIAGIDGLATDNCEVTLTETYEKNIQCNAGTIKRIFNVVDKQGLTSSTFQTITITNTKPFYINGNDHNDPNDDVVWPKSIEINSCNNVMTHPDQTGYPIYVNTNCAQVAANWDDTKLTVLDSTCYKILRKWVVIDWCQYDRIKLTGIWEYTQVIAVKSSEPPTLETCGEVDFCDQNAFYNPNTKQCLGTYNLKGSGYDDCTDPQDLIWKHRLDVDNDGSFDPPILGDVATGVLPIGTHRLRWILTDQCGNSSTCDQVFKIRDCKKPTPYCINGVVTVIMPSTGAITVWARDLNLNSFDNCTRPEKLFFSFSPDINNTSVTYNCDSLFRQRIITKVVRIYVTDEYGNQDYCETTIRIQDNNNACPTNGPGFNLSGTVTIANNDALVNAEITLKDQIGNTITQQTTDIKGNYAFHDLHLSDFSLIASKNDEITNGVSTMDIVLIQRHILGLKLLNSPYKMLAADVNNSNTISAKDVSDIRRAILGIVNEFPNGTPSWKFIKADHIFLNPELPWNAPGTIESNTVPDQFDQLNFMGIKTGDVDLSAEINVKNAGNQQRSNSISWTYGQVNIHQDGSLQIDIKTTSDVKLDGFQLGLSMDLLNASFKEVRSAACDINPEDYRIEANQLKISWVPNRSLELKAGTILFTIKLQTSIGLLKAADYLKMLKGFSSEVYLNDKAYSLNIQNENGIKSQMIFYSLQPNPFSEYTNLRFEMPTEGTAILKVYDLTGKNLHTMDVKCVQGINELRISKKDLATDGLMYYVLSSAFGTISDRMIVLE
ncbi:MAG: hypothetical protein IPO86_06885 [Saprospiraceae bacterium]|nr:hypothetical protein [Saprospiraceae bacterium]